jgi:hypothetical protein
MPGGGERLHRVALTARPDTRAHRPRRTLPLSPHRAGGTPPNMIREAESPER